MLHYHTYHDIPNCFCSLLLHCSFSNIDVPAVQKVVWDLWCVVQATLKHKLNIEEIPESAERNVRAGSVSMADFY